LPHFVEHMLFSGTERWPEAQLYAILRDKGGDFNGWTGFDTAGYWVQLPQRRLRLTEELDLSIHARLFGYTMEEALGNNADLGSFTRTELENAALANTTAELPLPWRKQAIRVVRAIVALFECAWRELRQRPTPAPADAPEADQRIRRGRPHQSSSDSYPPRRARLLQLCTSPRRRDTCLNTSTVPDLAPGSIRKRAITG
jgi:hypothetical protein